MSNVDYGANFQANPHGVLRERLHALGIAQDIAGRRVVPMLRLALSFRQQTHHDYTKLALLPLFGKSIAVSATGIFQPQRVLFPLQSAVLPFNAFRWLLGVAGEVTANLGWRYSAECGHPDVAVVRDNRIVPPWRNGNQGSQPGVAGVRCKTVQSFRVGADTSHAGETGVDQWCRVTV
jgi:hypothetical protein